MERETEPSVDLEESATKLQRSFEEMHETLTEFSESMTDVADGFEKVSRNTANVEASPETPGGHSTSQATGFGAADD